MENTERFWITSQRNWILCIHCSWISSKFILMLGFSLGPNPSLAKFLGMPCSRLPDISAPPWLLSRKSFHRSMVLQCCGIPEQLENGYFAGSVQVLPTMSSAPLNVSCAGWGRRIAEAVAGVARQRTRAQLLPLNPLCSPLSKQKWDPAMKIAGKVSLLSVLSKIISRKTNWLLGAV